MKKYIILFTTMMFSIMLSAQTQQGYVKTKGRLGNDGSVIAGTRIPNATIQVKDRTPVVSQANGVFSFPIPANKFYLQNVQKQGYVLTDPEVLSKQYDYSSNDLVIVMENLAQQEADRLAIERKISSKLYAQLQQRGEEIDALREQNKITEEKYRELLQKLNKDQKDNEKIIKEMAERYAKMDFDQIDEFKRKVSEYILNGELLKADSMLNSKGDINQRVKDYQKHKAINAEEKEELTRRQASLELSETAAQEELEDLANDCFSKYEIFKMQHLNDTAAYYIELRSELDTTNVVWGIEAGIFNSMYTSDYTKAMSYYQMALRHSSEEQVPNKWTALCLSKIGVLYNKIGNQEASLKYHQEALDIQKSIFGENHRLVAKTLNNISSVYYRKGDLPKSQEYVNQALSMLTLLDENDSEAGVSYNLLANIYMKLDSCDLAIMNYNKALKITKDNHGETDGLVATLYNNIAYVYNHQGNPRKAMELYQKALEIDSIIYGVNHPNTADRYDNIGYTYHKLGDIDNAISNNTKALEIRESIFKWDHPDKAISYNNVGYLYYEKKDYLVALEYYNKALAIFKNYYEESHPRTAQVYENMGAAYIALGEYSKGIEFENKAVEIRIKKYGDSHSSLSSCYNNIGHAYSEQKDYQTALLYLGKALEISKHAYGDSHYNVASILSNIGDLYFSLEDYDNALMHYETALKIRVSAFGEDHPKTVLIKDKISETQAKLKEQETAPKE